jgi:hypothetical protein
LFGEVCEKFNISVPVLGSNGSANGTNVTSGMKPSSTGEPYDIIIVTGLGGGLLGFVVLAVLL